MLEQLKLKLTRAGHWCNDSMVSVTWFKVLQLHVLRLMKLMAHNCHAIHLFYNPNCEIKTISILCWKSVKIKQNEVVENISTKQKKQCKHKDNERTKNIRQKCFVWGIFLYVRWKALLFQRPTLRKKNERLGWEQTEFIFICACLRTNSRSVIMHSRRCFELLLHYPSQ